MTATTARAMTHRVTPATTQSDTTRLVGRARLLHRVERELIGGRPVNLRGGPGVGKSQVLRALAARHHGPVHLVSEAAGESHAPCVRDTPQDTDPLLVLVDDAQLLPRLEVARIHALQAQPWCRVVTAVGSDATPDDRLGSWWDAGPWRRLEVTPLDRRATALLVERLLGGPAEPSLVHEVWRSTGGNPVAIKELLHDAQETGCVGPGADSWRLVEALPLRRLTAWVNPRLEGLSEEAQHELRILSVASPLPVRAAASLIDARAARELEARGLVRYQASARGRTLGIIDPVHAEVVRASMLPDQRRAVLEALAATFDRLGVKGWRRLELARWRAEIGGWSAAQLGSASAMAHARGDAALAGRLAHAALEEGDDATASRVASLAANERCAGAPVDPTTGHSPCGTDSVSPAAGNEVDELVAAHAEAVGSGRFDAAVRALLAGGARGEVAAHRPAPTAYAAVLQVLGGDVRGAAQHLAAAKAALEREGDDAEATTARPGAQDRLDPAVTRGVLAVGEGLVGLHAVEAQRVEDAVDALAVRWPGTSTLSLLSTAEHLVAGAQLLTDDERPLRERIVEASDEVDGSLRRFGAETGWWYAVEGWLRWEAGDLATARDRLVAAMLACRTADPIRLRALVLADLAVLAGLNGSAVEAEWRLGQVGSDREHNLAVAHRCEVAEILVRCARRGTHGAGDDLVALAERARQQGRLRDARMAWHLVARLECEADAARRAAAAVVEVERQRMDPVLEGVAAHLTAWADGDGHGLERAARTLAAKGRTLLAAEAAHQAARAGAGTRAGALAGALVSACTDATTVGVAGCTPVELSPRRRDAAVLAMRGMDGRSIADRLGVSVRTVENHLARVYRLVGVAGRQELSALFALGEAPFAEAVTA